VKVLVNCRCVMYFQTGIMLTVLEQKRLRDLITDTVTMLCQSTLNFRSKFSVEGLLGVTVDEKDVFLINIHEVMSSRKEKRCRVVKEKSISTVNDNEDTTVSERRAVVARARSPMTQNAKKSSSKRSFCSVPCSAPQNMFAYDQLDEQIAHSFTHEIVQSQMPLTSDTETLPETRVSLSSRTSASQLLEDAAEEVQESQDRINAVKEEIISEIDASDSQLDYCDRDLLMECNSVWSDNHDTGTDIQV